MPQAGAFREKLWTESTRNGHDVTCEAECLHDEGVAQEKGRTGYVVLQILLWPAVGEGGERECRPTNWPGGVEYKAWVRWVCAGKRVTLPTPADPTALASSRPLQNSPPFGRRPAFFRAGSTPIQPY